MNHFHDCAMVVAEPLRHAYHLLFLRLGEGCKCGCFCSFKLLLVLIIFLVCLDLLRYECLNMEVAAVVTIWFSGCLLF